MEKKVIKVKFDCFWPDFNLEDNFLLNALKKHYTVVISDNPDFLFYSIFGPDFKGYTNCVKVFYSEENISPIFNDCDYAIAHDNIVFGDRYLRLSVDSQLLTPEVQNRENLSTELTKRKFCNFVYTNSNSGEGSLQRVNFCKKLMKYKHVDCAGKVLNNMKGGISKRYTDNWWQDKLEFVKNYKFTIAFENSSSLGYTTEKLIQPMMANSVPIYWGNPEVVKEYNPKAFVNCNDYENFDAVIEKIKELDNNQDLYMEMLRQPAMQPDYKFNKQEQLENFLIKIIEKGNKPFNKNPRNWDYNEKLLRDIVDYRKIRFKYRRYQFLAKFAWGKTREYYQFRRDSFRNKAVGMKNLVLKLKAIK